MSGANKTTLCLRITADPKENWKNFKKALLECEHVCPECYSLNVLHYFERLVIYDRNSEIIGFKDWGLYPYSAFQCEDWGWENF